MKLTNYNYEMKA